MGALVAGVGTLLPAPGGVIVGRFAFADLSAGQAFNAQADAGASPVVGFVVPSGGTWQRIYRYQMPDGSCVRVLRPGLGITLLRRGDLWARFPSGAARGLQVYASTVDGSCLAGYSAGAIPTPWYAVETIAPGAVGRISTWSNYT